LKLLEIARRLYVFKGLDDKYQEAVDAFLSLPLNERKRVQLIGGRMSSKHEEKEIECH
jgi:hypothetical protein